jgi:hypothetical protein
MPKLKDPLIQGVLDYRRFYGRPAPEKPIASLEKYPTDMLIVILAKVNALIFQSGNDLNQIDNDVFRLVFNKLDRSIYEKIIEIRNTDAGSRGSIFTSPPLVGLMGKLIAKYRPVTESDAISDEGLQVMMKELFDAILAVNDNYFNSANNTDMLSKHHLWKLEFLQQGFARAVPNMFGVIPIKIFMFYRFMGERYGEEILKEFATNFNVASAYNFYFVFLQTIATTTNEFLANGQPRYCIMDETLEKVIAPFVFDPAKPQKTLFAGESFVLINQPFFQLFEGIAVLDFSFFAHLTDISLLYHFYHSTSLKQKHGIKNYNEYLGMIGKHFYEEYLLVQLLQKLFSHKYDHLFTDKDDPAYPDILVMQNKTDVFVIEVKSVRVHGKVLDQADTAGFQQFLEDEFANEKTGAGEQNKGIYQLKKQIQHLKSQGRGYRIFPVIVYTETSLDAAGVNSFLDEKFDAIIEGERPSFKKIHPLTLINLHFFIKYFPAMKKQRYFLRNKITEYHLRKKRELKTAMKTGNPYIYFIAEYSFMRMMEQTYPAGDPMSYFLPTADDLGFRDEAKNAPVT